MANETELQRLVVRLVGDASSYQQMLESAQRQSADAAQSIERSLGAFDRVQQKLEQVGKAVQDVGARIQKVGTTLTKFLTLPITAGAFAITKFNKAWETQRTSVEGLRQLFKTTGRDAEMTVEQIEKFAAARQEITNFGDEVTIQAATILASYRRIRSEAFERTLVAAQDVASVMRTDMRSAAMQLGKALDNPRIGLGMLSRAGITFSEEQKKQIKLLQEAGKILEAQELILTEVEAQYKGAAEAMVSPLEQVRNTLGDIAEQIGKTFTPLIKAFQKIIKDISDRYGKTLARLRDQVEELSETHGELIIKVTAFAAALGPMLVLLGTFAQLIGFVISGLGKAGFVLLGLVTPQTLVVGGLVAIIAGLVALQKKTGIFTPLIESAKRVFQELKTKLLPVLREIFREIARALGPVMQALTQALAGVLAAMEPLIPIIEAQLIGAIRSFAMILETVVIPALRIVTSLVERLSSANKILEGSFSVLGALMGSPGTALGGSGIGGATGSPGALAGGFLGGRLGGAALGSLGAPPGGTLSGAFVPGLSGGTAPGGIGGAFTGGSKGASRGPGPQAGIAAIKALRNAVGPFRVDLEGLARRVKSVNDQMAIWSKQFKEGAKRIVEFNKLHKDTKELTRSLQFQVDTFDMSAQQAAIYALEIRGATDGQLKLARTLSGTIDKLREQEELFLQGEKLTEQFLTPLEKFKKTHQDLAKLFQTGAIGQKTFTRAMKAAKKELEDVNKEVGKLNRGFGLIQSPDVGSIEHLMLLSQLPSRASKQDPATGAGAGINLAQGAAGLFGGLIRPSGLGAGVGQVAQDATKGIHDLTKRGLGVWQQIAKNTDPRGKKAVEIENADLGG